MSYKQLTLFLLSKKSATLTHVVKIIPKEEVDWETADSPWVLFYLDANVRFLILFFAMADIVFISQSLEEQTPDMRVRPFCYHVYKIHLYISTEPILVRPNTQIHQSLCFDTGTGRYIDLQQRLSRRHPSIGASSLVPGAWRLGCLCFSSNPVIWWPPLSV